MSAVLNSVAIKLFCVYTFFVSAKFLFDMHLRFSFKVLQVFSKYNIMCVIEFKLNQNKKRTYQ